MSATNALLYLYGASFRGALTQRFKRLRQPKYLAGAIVGGAYFYFFFFRNVFRATGGPAAAAPATAALYVPLAALVLFILVALGWILPSGRAALLFTEAGVAFLFPAPVSRRTLIHSQLLRSQIAIFISAFFLTLVFRRGSAFGGNALTHALGWWAILSTLNLHLLGASFVREWLLGLGLQHRRRQLVLGGVLLAIVAGCWFAVRRTVAAPTDLDTGSFTAMADYAHRVLTTAPVSWVLFPFTLVVRPYFATDWPSFLLALAPTLLLLLAHYFWVARTNISFEEASLELAGKRAERIAAMRAGRWRARNLPTKPRAEPFKLAARGWVPVAYLWKNLISLGSLYRLRTWLIACAVAIAGTAWLAADPGRQPLLKMAGLFAVMFSIWTALFIPMLMRRELQQTLEHLDIVKSYPLAGWQVVLGGLITPMTLMVFIEWWLLLVAVLALGTTTHDATTATLLGAAGAGGIALLLPPLCGLMLCIPYAGVLYFPAWAQAPGAQPAGGGGIEVMGQRLIFMLGYVVVLLVAVLPAAGVGGLVCFIAYNLIGHATAFVLTAVTASAILGAELVGAVHWLGGKVEKFDLSTELPR